jgi:rhodanese-related sulfurtransferase
MNSQTIDRRNFIALAAFGSLGIVWSAITSSRPDPLDAVRELTIAEAKAAIDAGAIVIDVREAAVAATSHVNGALIIPLEVLHSKLPALEAYRTSPIVVYCGNGSTRGPVATALLNQNGFPQAANMSHGIQGWRAAGLPTTAT